MGLLKICMIATNILIWVIGVALLSVGIWAAIDSNFKKNLCLDENDNDSKDFVEAKKTACRITYYVQPSAIVIAIIGAITFLVGFCGCCGAFKESRLLLAIYTIILSILLIALIAISVMVLVQYKGGLYNKEEPSSLQKSVSVLYSNEIKQYDKQQNSDWLILLGPSQALFECCGDSSNKDYVTAPPKTCYPKEDTNKSVFTEGCTEKVLLKVEQVLKIVGIVALILAILMILGVLGGFCLCRDVTAQQVV